MLSFYCKNKIKHNKCARMFMITKQQIKTDIVYSITLSRLSKPCVQDISLIYTNRQIIKKYIKNYLLKMQMCKQCNTEQ